jgi:large subunit ribosomal protein L30
VSGKLTITQVRGTVGQSKAHEGTLRALGLGKIGRSVEHTDSPSLAGMLRHVKHLVRVEGAGARGVGSTEPRKSAGGGSAGAGVGKK